MSEFSNGFTDTYHDVMVDIMDIGEELSLIYAPAVAMTRTPLHEDVQVMIHGESVQEFSLETPEGIDVEKEIKIGESSFQFLDGAATFELVSALINAKMPNRGPSFTPEQYAVGTEIASSTSNRIKSGHHAYVKHEFVNNKTGESIVCTSVRINDANEILLAREISVVVSDEYLARTLTLRELPVSLEGKNILGVTQSFAPVQNQTLKDAATFFQENSMPEGLDIVCGLFASELMGIQNNEVEGFLARYEGTPQLERLELIVTSMRLMAAEAKESNKFTNSNPEMTLPSADELYEYKTLLSQMRA